jgi:regulator of replication initiation timing
MTETEKILSRTLNRLEQEEQAQWKKINELEQQNQILQDENMHLKDFLAEAYDEIKQLKTELNAHPCLTNRKRSEEVNNECI